MPYRSSSVSNSNNKQMIPPPTSSSPASPTTGVSSSLMSRQYPSGSSGMNQYPSTTSSNPYSSSPPRRVGGGGGGGQRFSTSSTEPLKKKNHGGMLSSFLMQHQQDRSPTAIASAGGVGGGAGAADALSIGETIMTEDLEDKGLQRVIEIQSNNNSHHSRSGNHHHHHTPPRGNRPALDRRVSILSLGEDDDQSYILDLASQKERRAQERHEEALEEALEKVNAMVRAMARPQRPSTDSDEYALLFLKVLAETKAALQIKYEQRDKMMDQKLDELLREGIARRRRYSKDNDNNNDEGTTTNNDILHQSASSGLANICEDQSSCCSGSSSNSGNRSHSSSNNNGNGNARRPGHKSVYGDDEHTDPTYSTSTRTTVTTEAAAATGTALCCGPLTSAEKKAACVKIQSTYRRYRVQSVFGPLLEGVHVHQERVQRQHRAVRRIQAAYRGHRTHVYFVEVLQGVREKNVRSQAAVRIQAVCRRFITRIFYLELMEGLKSKQGLEQEKDHMTIEDELTVDSDNEEEILVVDDASYRDATIDGTLMEEEFFEESIDDLDEEYMEFSEDEIEIVDDGSDSSQPTIDEANAAVVCLDSKGGKSGGKWTTGRITRSSTEQTASLKTLSPTLLPSYQYQNRLAANATRSTTRQSPMSPTGKPLRSPSGNLAERMKMFESPKTGPGVPLTSSNAKRTWQKPAGITIRLDGDEQKPGGGPGDPSHTSAFAAVLTHKAKSRSGFANQSTEACDAASKLKTVNAASTPKNEKSKVIYDLSLLKKKLKKLEKMIVECNDPMELEKLRKKKQSYVDDIEKQDQSKAQGRDGHLAVAQHGMHEKKKDTSTKTFPPTIARDRSLQPTEVYSKRTAGSALTKLTNISPAVLEAKDDVASMKSKTCSFGGKEAVAVGTFAPSCKRSKAKETSSFVQQLLPKGDPASENKLLLSTRSSEETPCSSPPVRPDVLVVQEDVQCASGGEKKNGTADTKYALADFEQKLVQGVNMAEWELHLTESEFHKHFAMSKKDFTKQPKWKREKQKRKVRVNF